MSTSPKREANTPPASVGEGASSHAAPRSPAKSARLPGRKGQAAANDERILAAARAVFIANPEAPISDVAVKAGVGISALYRRYSSKEELLRELCAQGLQRFTAEAQAALDSGGDAWTAFARFLRGVVEADTHSLTISLAGTFTPTEELFRSTEKANALALTLFNNARASGALRSDVEYTDLPSLFEQLASIRLGDEARTWELRQRYLALLLEALRAPGAGRLPGRAPTEEELGRRWQPRVRSEE